MIIRCKLFPRKFLTLSLGLIILFIFSSLAENNLYQQDSLELQLEVKGSLELVSKGSQPLVRDLSVDLFLVPEESFRQKVLEFNPGEGEEKKAERKITYSWAVPEVGTKKWQYTAKIKTLNERLKVSRKVSFPLSDITGYEQYIRPTEKIDSEHPLIVQKATELAEGEDDLFKVVFKLANWVEENVNYQLNALTTEQAQKASWVLENKQGVCDEMTSLFIAMCRTLGIPARFVSGISYTEKEDIVQAVGGNWAGHGWAEVYFLGIGWVSFDIPFGEYGYVDVTHLKLRESLDPDEPATRYSWLAQEVDLEPKKMKLNVEILQTGNTVPEKIQLEENILASEVKIGSYNLIKGILKNKAHYYSAATLQLGLPSEMEIVGRNRRTILLMPGEIKETYWLVKVNSDLDADYYYQFPVAIYSEKNVSVMGMFSAKEEGSFYSQEEIEQLVVKDEEKSYSRRVLFDCSYPRKIKSGEKAEFGCQIKNVGNTNLNRVQFCLGNVCDFFDLPINQKKSVAVKVVGEKVGWNKLMVSAENELIEKKTALEYQVLDVPEIVTTVVAPEIVKYGNTFQVQFHLQKKSFVSPKDVLITVTGMGLKNEWELPKLERDEDLVLELSSARISRDNKFRIVTSWRDEEEKEYSQIQEILVKGEAEGLADKCKLLLNGILNWFYR